MENIIGYGIFDVKENDFFANHPFKSIEECKSYIGKNAGKSKDLDLYIVSYNDNWDVVDSRLALEIEDEENI